MTPHLHPRSRLTSSLFGTTLLVSFLVVGMPHIIPCPAPRVKFADSEIEVLEDGKTRRRRQQSAPFQIEDVKEKDVKAVGILDEKNEVTAMKKKAHECPVPKPGGRIGEVLGFRRGEQKEGVEPTIEVLETGKDSK